MFWSLLWCQDCGIGHIICQNARLNEDIYFVTGAMPESRLASEKMTKSGTVFPSFCYTCSDLLPCLSSQWNVEIERTIYQNVCIDDLRNWEKYGSRLTSQKKAKTVLRILLLQLLYCSSSLFFLLELWNVSYIEILVSSNTPTSAIGVESISRQGVRNFQKDSFLFLLIVGTLGFTWL